MSNNLLKSEHFPGVEEMNEEAARQAAREAGERALSLRPRSPAPAAADVEMGGMDNDDMPAQEGAENPAPGAEEPAQDGSHALEVLRLERWRGGNQRGNLQPSGQTRRRGPGDRRSSRSQAHWNRGRQEGHRAHYGGHRGLPTQIFNARQVTVNISVANPADAARLGQQWGGPRPNHPHRGRGDQRRGAGRGPRRGDRGRGQQ